MTNGRSDKQGAKRAAKVIPLPKRDERGRKGGGKAGARCPICGKPASPEHRPFCSARCAEIDLGRWLKGVYRVPTEEAPSEEGPAVPHEGEPGDGEPGRGEEEPE